MAQSSFGNPHGLPNQRTCSNCYELAILVSTCMKINIFNEIVGTQQKRFWINSHGNSKEMLWENTNKLLRREGFVGVKTGVTVTAGPCLATCFKYKAKKYIIVLLKTSKLSRRFK